MNKGFSQSDEAVIDEFYSAKVVLVDDKVVKLKDKKLKDYFPEIQSKEKRNKNIKQSYQDGYTQSEIAKHLSLSVASISKIIKKLN